MVVGTMLTNHGKKLSAIKADYKLPLLWQLAALNGNAYNWLIQRGLVCVEQDKQYTIMRYQTAIQRKLMHTAI